MASAGDKEVGRVSIRVVPNTDNFRRDVERELKGLPDGEVDVKPDLDEKKLQRDLKDADARVDVEAELDNPQELKQKLRDTIERVKETAKVSAELDENGFRANVRAMIDAAKSELEVDASLNSHGFAAQALAARAMAEQIFGKIKAKVDFDENGATAKAIAWSKATSRAMKLNVEIALRSDRFKKALGDTMGLAERAVRPFYRMFGGDIIEGMVKGFTRFKGAIAIGTIAVSGMGVVLAPLISHAGQAAVAFAKVAGAIAPSVITAGALAYGALFKAFDGMGSALKANTVEELNAAIEGMGPATRRAATGMFDLKQAYNAATERAQEGFWSGITTDFADLTPVVDTVGRAVTTLGFRFGLATGRVTDFLSTQTGFKIFDSMIQGSTRAAGSLFDGLANAIPGLLAVGSVGAQTFAEMTRGIDNAAAAWSDRMLAKLRSGELQAAMDENLNILSRFWDGATNVGTIIGGVFSAMTKEGQGLLDPLAGITARTAEWVKSAEGTAALENFFSSIGDIVSTLAPVFGEVAGTVVDTVVPALADMVTAAGPGLERMGEAISNALEDIAPHLEGIGEKIGDFLTAAAPIVEKVAPAIPALFGMAAAFRAIKFVSGVAAPVRALGSAFKGIKGVGKKAGETKLWSKAAKGAGSAAKGASPHVASFGKGVLNTSKVAAKGMARLVPGLGTALLIGEAGRFAYKNWEPFRNTVDKTRDAVVDFGKTTGEKFSEGMDRAKERFNKIPDNFKRAGENASDRWKSATKPISDWFNNQVEEGKKRETKLAGGGLPSVEDIKQRASELKTAAAEAFQGMGESIGNAWDGVKDWWSTSWDGISSFMTGKWDSLKETATNTWSTAKETVSNAWDGVQEWWGNTWDSISTSVSEKWNSIKENASSTWDTAKTVVGNAWEGVQDRWSNTWGTVSTTVGSVWGGIKTNAATTWSTAKDTVSTAWDGVSDTWSGVWSGVSSTLSDTWDGIKTNASSAFDNVKSYVTDAWDGVSSDTSSKWGSVATDVASNASEAQAAATAMASQIMSFIQSMWDSVVAETIGALASFVSTVMSGFQQAVSLAASLPGQFQSALGNLGGLLVASGRSLVQGFINGIQSMVGAVASAAQSVVSAARDFFPFSPAKEGPFSGRGYTTYSGKALVKDFAGGMTSEVRAVRSAAEGVAKAANEPFERYNRNKILQPVLESNAKKINDSRKREAEAEQEHQKRLAEIQKEGGKTHEKIAEENEKHAERMAEIRKDLDESLEAPDYSNIERSFRGFYVEGAKGLLNEKLMQAVDSRNLVDKARESARRAIAEARAVVGDHPVLADVEYNVNSEHFEYAFKKAVEESQISAVPVEFVISNLEQLKSDLGMGDGLVSRAIDQAVQWNWNNTDAKRFRDDNPYEVHYHVEDMQEAIRREDLRVRKQMMKMK